MLYSFFRLILILLLKSFFRFDVEGREFIPKKGGFILASNHLSYLDPIAAGVACPRKLNFMAKDSLFYNPFLARFFHVLGAFPVKRNSIDTSAMKEAIARLNNGKVLLIFPEGSRQVGGFSATARRGIGFLAVKSNLPVIPAFIKGTDSVLPKGSKFIRPGAIKVYFGREISIERSESHNYQAIADKIMRSIGHLACS